MPSATSSSNVGAPDPPTTGSITPADAPLLGQSATGEPTLRYSAQWLCSSEDPRLEAQTWAEAQVSSCQPGSLVVIFGLGVGYHVEALRQLVSSDFVVFEMDLRVVELARGARGAALSGFDIVCDVDALRRSLFGRVKAYQHVHVLGWPPSRRLFASDFVRIAGAVKEAVATASITAWTLESRLRVWVEHALSNLVRCVGRVPAVKLKPHLEGRPAFIVAAGPSLDHNVHHLKELAGRGTIIAVNTSLGALERAGVRADFVVAVEALDVSEQLELSLNRATPRVLALSSHPNLYANALGPVFPFVEGLAYFHNFANNEELGPAVPSGGSVANSAFSWAVCVGANPVVLVGQDLAFRGESVYASGTVFEKMRINVQGAEAHFSELEAKKRIAQSCPSIDTTRSREKTHWVPGWGDGEPVRTTVAFGYFREIFENWARSVPEIDLINATEGGSRIAGFREVRLEEVVRTLSVAEPLILPDVPVIQASTMYGLIVGELDRIDAALKFAQHGAEEATPAALNQLRELVNESGFLEAWSWDPLSRFVRGKESDVAKLLSTVVSAGEEISARLQALLPQLREVPQ